MTQPRPTILAPTRDVVLEATTTADGAARLASAARSAGAVAVLFEQASGEGPQDARPRHTGIEPSVAALHFGLATPDLGVLVAASPGRDAPYNLARRILSLDHFLGGRVGVLLEPGGPGGPGGPGDAGDAGDAGDPSTEAGEALAAEEAQLLRELWNSWPLEAVVGDRATGVFADTGRIRRVEHRGEFTVDGPLTTPGSVQGEPVLVWRGGVAPAAADLTTEDVLLVPLAALPGVAGGATAARPGPDAEAAGVSVGDHRDPAAPTLRSLLGLAERRLDTSGWPPAFAAPRPTGAA